MCDTQERQRTDSSSTNGGDARSSDDVSRNDLFRALADERRRTILSLLGEESEPIDVEALARSIAVCESTTEHPSEDRIESVHVSLHHVDLPKLASVGVVRYDRDRRTVESAAGDGESLLADAIGCLD